MLKKSGKFFSKIPRTATIAIVVASVLIAAGGTTALLIWNKQAGMPVHQIDFNRDIRPILNNNCTSCHGGVKQAGKVSFIYREQALGTGKSGRPTVIPGRPNASELIARVTSSDPEVRMPLHAPPLSDHQISLLEKWIDEGAPWEDYWAFVPPEPQALPEVHNNEWVRQPLDRFILARLETEQFKPSPEAEKAALLRRASFDLTGLPPTPEELTEFLADTSPGAYEKQIDRLLSSPHFGERWAAHWLDLARYADTKGYGSDKERAVWPWRDWVIQAFNRNLPYDQFVITQLAGDLLPNAGLEDRIATSFHRQTPNNDELGTDSEEFRLMAVTDRTATTWSVLNGVTMNCVQCHSHPYDPIRHDEYYKFLAFFNTSRDADLPDNSPTLRVPLDIEKYPEAERLQKLRSTLQRTVMDNILKVEADKSQWQPLVITTALANAELGLKRQLENIKDSIPDGTSQAADEEREALQRVVKRINDQIAKLRSDNQSVVDLQITEHGEAMAKASTPASSVYMLTAPLSSPTLTALRVEVLPIDPSKARHTPEQGFIVDQIEAWLVQPDGKKAKIDFAYFAPDSEWGLKNLLSDDSEIFSANPKLFQKRWTTGILCSPATLAPGSHIKVQLTQIGNIDAKPANIRRVRLVTSDDPRWTSLPRNPEFTDNVERLKEVARKLEQMDTAELPIMDEQPGHLRRTTLKFDRGNFLTKVGPALQPDVPEIFPELPESEPRNRLTMAKWLFHPKQPLTARVAVNRFWEQLFGLGIVETLEDFGSVGEMPSHPELLDWLALHFQNDLDWDIKALLRELVTSATYRQSAKTTAVLQEKDPRNRLLARGPQQRLTAEMVRDQALLASGLLAPTIGGASVMPPQPDGVWPEGVGEALVKTKWVNAAGPDRYRRGLYTYLKRSAMYPSFLIFDAPARTVSLARRIPTNTPLQALVTLNDPVYDEASEALARLMLEYFPSSDTTSLLDARLSYGALRVLSRSPTRGELQALLGLYSDVLNTEAVSGDTSSDSQEFVAFTAVASALLNLDAALVR